jgi:hypothetical protein
LGVFEHHKTHSLIGTLPKQSRDVSLVQTTNSIRLPNLVNTLEEILVLRVSTKFIMDELCLEGFLRGHYKSGLHCSSEYAAHEAIESALPSKHLCSGPIVGVETQGVLWHTEQEEGTVPSVHS